MCTLQAQKTHTAKQTGKLWNWTLIPHYLIEKLQLLNLLSLSVIHKCIVLSLFNCYGTGLFCLLFLGKLNFFLTKPITKEQGHSPETIQPTQKSPTKTL